jgi:uncharacterized protein YecT (DUF1311 family)
VSTRGKARAAVGTMLRTGVAVALLFLGGCGEPQNAASPPAAQPGEPAGSAAPTPSKQPETAPQAPNDPASAVGPGSYPSFKLSTAESEQRESKVYARCLDRSGGVTIHMRNCSAAEAERLDALLNSTYRRALARLPTEAAREELRAQQRQWLKTRYDHCDKELEEAGEGGPNSGTMALLILDGCGLSEDDRRIAWLERYRGS